MPPRDTEVLADSSENENEEPNVINSESSLKRRRKPVSEKGEAKIEVNKASDDRFNRRAETNASVDSPCVLTIDGLRLDVSAWARAHPGGTRVLQKFHRRDASKAFRAVGHSDAAYELLKDFSAESVSTDFTGGMKRNIPRWVTKLFTKEDRYGFHKVFGAFCLCNYTYRFSQMLFGDPAAGMGSYPDRGGPNATAALCLIPHAMLSLSSLVFHTVPRERVVGKPMIWKEFRIHSIIFGLRSVVCSAVTWLSVYHGHRAPWRTLAVVVSSLSVLAACAGADMATDKLRHCRLESTTATMPYWPGCESQKTFKHFYAIAQFGATITLLMASNPTWPLAILLPIQGAAFLMTLVRKGIISARSYHVWYSVSLFLVFLVGIRHLFLMRSPDLLGLFVLENIMYQLRRKGVSKYAMWVPLVVVRILIGDRFLNWQCW